VPSVVCASDLRNAGLALGIDSAVRSRPRDGRAGRVELELSAQRQPALEVARAGRATRVTYEAELLRVVEATAAGLPGKTPAARRKLAWAVLAALSGGVTLARAADDAKVGAQIAAALKAMIDEWVAAAAA
jgi:hypothetical protein